MRARKAPQTAEAMVAALTSSPAANLEITQTLGSPAVGLGFRAWGGGVLLNMSSLQDRKRLKTLIPKSCVSAAS